MMCKFAISKKKTQKIYKNPYMFRRSDGGEEVKANPSFSCIKIPKTLATVVNLKILKNKYEHGYFNI